MAKRQKRVRQFKPPTVAEAIAAGLGTRRNVWEMLANELRADINVRGAAFWRRRMNEKVLL